MLSYSGIRVAQLDVFFLVLLQELRKLLLFRNCPVIIATSCMVLNLFSGILASSRKTTLQLTEASTHTTAITPVWKITSTILILECGQTM